MLNFNLNRHTQLIATVIGQYGLSSELQEREVNCMSFPHPIRFIPFIVNTYAKMLSQPPPDMALNPWGVPISLFGIWAYYLLSRGTDIICSARVHSPE